MQEMGNLFYLLVRLREERVMAVMMKDKAGPWLLIEWCCEDDSKMASWFLQAGHAAMRLGRPQWDLRDPGHVDLVVAKMIEAARRGFKIIIWASLPCRPWSTWQQVNVAISEAVRANIEADREESRRMVQQLARAVRLLQEADVEVEVAYEWPRMASGWKEPKIQKALNEMGATSVCEFDGCRYQLTDQAGLPVMKPWRVQTSMRRLVEPLSLRCDRSHEHGECRGRMAIRSGLYTDMMVKRIGYAITGGINHGSITALEDEDQDMEEQDDEKDIDMEEHDGEKKIDVEKRRAHNRHRWAEPKEMKMEGDKTHDPAAGSTSPTCGTRERGCRILRLCVGGAT